MDSIWFYPLAIMVVLLVGVAKGGFAGGVGSLSVPILALVIDPRIAAAIMLPIICVMDLFAVHSYRGEYHRANLRILIPAGLVGVFLGAITFQLMNVAMIKLIIGVIAIHFVINYFYNQRKQTAPVSRPVNTISGSVWGTIAGFTSCVAHAGGPPLSVYLLPQHLDKRVFAGTMVLFFIVINYSKLLPYYSLGLLQFSQLKISLILLPMAPIGVWLGSWLTRRVEQTVFYRISYIFLFMVGIKLLFDACTSWF